MKQAILHSVKRGKQRDNVYFKLFSNGLLIGTSETFADKDSAISTIAKNLPDYTVVDNTDSKQEVEIVD